ncbi:MAG: TolC family protein, partial [Planctomycetota bacterium]|nr:TolC family protein [Planctomycetota bacterium]
WYQLAEARGQVRIAREQIRTNEDVLKIVNIRRQKGVARAADSYRQQQLVASTEAQLIVAEEAEELLQYQLSVLIGNKPELAWEEVSVAFPNLPPAPRLGVPAGVLLRRPDVRQSYRQVQAADQRLAAAIADQYPRVSISANVETSSTTLVRDLFDDWLANLAANAIQPLFDGARRKAEVQRQEAVVAERIDSWSQTILDALRDVEAALTRQEQQRQLLENIEYRLGLARRTYARNRESYIKGQIDYIRVLESLQSLQTLERNVVTAQRTLVERRIDLHRSIAGPCDPPQPAPAQSSVLQEAANSESLIQDK